MLDVNSTLKQDIATAVRQALSEDVGSGDITARLIPAEEQAVASVITREDCIMCGQAWVEEVFRQLDPGVQLSWKSDDGARAAANTELLVLQGNARSLLTGERTALNFLQLLSGTATTCRHYADLVEGTGVKLLDTRKTIPGLRTAQKYAVRCGGCCNHRIGLYDAYLIKENHIAACGGITEAILSARKLAPEKPIEIEVENLDDLSEALAAKPDTIMLDNFSQADMETAVQNNDNTVRLEASGGITVENLKSVAATGVDFISIGALTKDCKAIDLSMTIR